ncbi:MAG TPA: Hsp20/alpha crystallin family protein [Synechococcales cyanobacterium M55_K2018_004]|nr:Hsp20/alpha crystallin family protein [Synechococcales cyanobacterium M55_K2018_004]
MALIRWQPMHELENLRKQMDRLFEEWMSGDGWIDRIGRPSASLLPQREGALWGPVVELKETDSDIILKAQLPGVKPADLDIQVTEDAVSIAGEHREESRQESEGMIRSEFRYGQFQRIVPLPMAIRIEEVKSDFQDGVLTLTMPKAEGSTRKVVKVSVGEAARESMVEQRQHEAHLQETMRARAAAEIGVGAGNSN